MNLRYVSYGTMSAVVSAMALVTGFEAASVRRGPIVAGLMIFALADNLTDSLSVHVYQESEHLERHAAWRATLSNFAARFTVTLSFVTLVWYVSAAWLILACCAWGLALLIVLSILLARERGVPIGREVGRHLILAAAVIVFSSLVGQWVTRIVN